MGGKQYYLDSRLRQLRNIDDPHDFVDLTVTERDALEYLTEHDVYEIQTTLPRHG